MGAKSILVIGNYGAGNLGDDAILGGIVTELRSIGYSGNISVTHGGFQSSTDIYKGLKKVPFMPSGVRSRLRRAARKEALNAIKQADLVVLGGGGLFVDSETWKAPLSWGAQAAACRKMGTPYICYGQSVGPLRSLISRQIAKKVFKHAKAIHVRDSQSAKVLQNLGFTEVTVGTDPAFSYLAQHKKPVKKGKALVISLRQWGKLKAKSWQPILEEVQSFAKKRKLQPIIVATDIRDKAELAQLKRTGLEVFEPPSAIAAFEGISRAKMAVTMRLHAGIFALAAKIPTLAISYNHKVASLIQNLAPTGAFKTLKTENLTAARIKKALTQLAKNPKVTVDLETPSRKNQDFLSKVLFS